MVKVLQQDWSTQNNGAKIKLLRPLIPPATCSNMPASKRIKVGNVLYTETQSIITYIVQVTTTSAWHRKLKVWDRAGQVCSVTPNGTVRVFVIFLPPGILYFTRLGHIRLAKSIPSPRYLKIWPPGSRDHSHAATPPKFIELPQAPTTSLIASLAAASLA